jgi:hypothetical protein
MVGRFLSEDSQLIDQTFEMANSIKESTAPHRRVNLQLGLKTATAV